MPTLREVYSPSSSAPPTASTSAPTPAFGVAASVGVPTAASRNSTAGAVTSRSATRKRIVKRREEISGRVGGKRRVMTQTPCQSSADGTTHTKPLESNSGDDCSILDAVRTNYGARCILQGWVELNRGDFCDLDGRVELNRGDHCNLNGHVKINYGDFCRITGRVDVDLGYGSLVLRKPRRGFGKHGSAIVGKSRGRRREERIRRSAVAKQASA